MLAHLAYNHGGPMVEVMPEDKELWKLLNDDWDARWKDTENTSKTNS
jgi:hypothetical protein